jgi:hypothetical protein
MFRVGRQVGDGDSADAGAGARVPVLIERAQVDVVVESFPCDATCALQVGPDRPPALALRRPGPGRRRATEPLGRRPDPYLYIWAPGSPAQLLPEATRDEIAGSFARRVILHQPLAYARTVATDLARGFAPTRATHGPTEALWRWQFQPRVPLFVDGLLCGDRRANHLEARQCASMLAGLQRFAARFGEHDLAVRPALARRLTNYRRFGYLPGPLLALALLTGAAGAVVAARRPPPGDAPRGRVLSAHGRGSDPHRRTDRDRALCVAL